MWIQICYPQCCRFSHLWRPVSGSYTLFTCACCFSYSSFVIGTMNLLKLKRKVDFESALIMISRVPLHECMVAWMKNNVLNTGDTIVKVFFYL